MYIHTYIIHLNTCSLTLTLTYTITYTQIHTHTHTQIASKLLSTESAIAVKTIRKIFKNFPEYGVIDVFSEYPTKDVVTSILSLSRLQRAVYTSKLTMDHDNNHEQHDNMEVNNTNNQDLLTRVLERNDSDIQNDTNSISHNSEHVLLADLAHYSVFAHAVYGWKMGLLAGKLHVGDLATLLQRTGIDKQHVIDTNWKSKTHLPVRFIL